MKALIMAIGPLLFLLFACGAESPQQEEEAESTTQSIWESLSYQQPTSLFGAELELAEFSDTAWRLEEGVLSAYHDEFIWTQREYDNFRLELEFKNAAGTNSGVIFYCSDKADWVPNSLEVQIADDYAEKWAAGEAFARSGAIYGHQPATPEIVKAAGEWNQLVVEAQDQLIRVSLNGEVVNEFNMAEFTSGTVNPDGSAVPPWLPNPPAGMPTKGYLGFQGKHGDAPIHFRNVRIAEATK